ncbi:hypothetical protein U6G28_05060 [Actinomycetaceae bacterium MB13-C1-2]|nr:hypothetical protein U6G28_05060 [Actinomycetaceae bacterium MB13-C1-2]
MQSRVFHMCVPLAEGTDRLFPLEDLATLAPNVYEAAAAKYKDYSKRKALRDTAMPGLDKKWSQVVFLTPVDPRAIWRRWLDRTGEKLPPVKFWAIDPKGIDERSVLLERTVSCKGAPIDPREVTRFNRESFETVVKLPAASEEWLDALANSGRKGAWFNGQPHVLVPAPVSLEGAEVIDWSE